MKQIKNFKQYLKSNFGTSPTLNTTKPKEKKKTVVVPKIETMEVEEIEEEILAPEITENDEVV